MGQAEPIFPDGEAEGRPIDRWSLEVGRRFLDWMGVSQGLRWLNVSADGGGVAREVVARCRPSWLGQFDVSQRLSFEDGAFDVVTMAQTLPSTPDPALALAHTVRLVRPGGWVGAYIWDFMGGGAPGYLISAGAKELGIACARPYGSEVSRLHILRDLWRDAGLVQVEPRIISIRVQYDSFDDFWDAGAAALEALSSEARARLQDHMRASLPHDPCGRIEFPAWANAVKGRAPDRSA